MTALKTTLLSFAALLLLGPSLAWGAASEWSTNPQSSVRLITPWQMAPRSGEVILGIQFRLSPGWHVYWKNSGDAGFPPTATFQPAAVLGTPEILWPTPSRFDLPGGLVAFGYEGEVVYPVRAEIKPAVPGTGATSDAAPPASAAGAAAGESLHITADLDYLVCQVDCVPFRYTLALDQPVGDTPVADPATVTILQSWVERLSRIVREVPGARTGAVLDASRAGEADLEVRVLGARATAGKTDLFLESHETFDAGRPRMKVLADGVVFHVPMKPKQANKPLPAKTSIAWTVSNLITKDGKPFSLEARREVQVWIDGGDARPDPLRDAALQPAGQDFPRLLFWAFLGGLLLNLAPAALALLAGETLALRFPGSGAREGAAAVVTGVVGGCWAVAGLALLARRQGWAADWAALLREPVVGALFVVAAAAFALNLWGLLEIPLAPSGAPRAGTGRHLLAGLFAVPLALAWPVPLLREPVATAFARGPAAVCAVFAVIGFGLAVPYLLLTLVPLSQRAPASWLPRLREGLGFLAGGSALWLLSLLARGVSPEGLAAVELALLAMSLFAWLRVREGTRKPARLVFALGLAACAAGVLWLADHNRLTPRSLTPQITAAAPAAELSTTRKPTSGG
jgi:DsbC/DsbD-like thiol-disulfide interchange protein